jgi:hypothetical protein
MPTHNSHGGGRKRLNKRKLPKGVALAPQALGLGRHQKKEKDNTSLTTTRRAESTRPVLLQLDWRKQFSTKKTASLLI